MNDIQKPPFSESNQRIIIALLAVLVALGVIAIVLFTRPDTSMPGQLTVKSDTTNIQPQQTDTDSEAGTPVTEDNGSGPSQDSIDEVPANEQAAPPAPAPAESPAQSPTSTPEIDTLIFRENLDTTFTQGYTYVAAGQKFVATGKPTFILPDSLKQKFQAASEKVNALYAPIYGEKNDILFFSTEAPSVSKNATTVGRVYAWNTKTSEVKVMYQISVVGNAAIPHTFGIAGSKLVLVMRSADWKPGMCDCPTPWDGGVVRSLELSDLSAALKAYILPQAVKDKAQVGIQRCELEKSKLAMCNLKQ